MIYQKFSKRQYLSMIWWTQEKFKNCDGIICDGSIRSGKSLSMTVGFILWAMASFQNQKFAICGKTIEALRRNIVLNLTDWLPLEYFSIVEKRAENKIIITDSCGNVNTFFMFGGRDESSYSLVQGITLAGCLLDEVALMPRSFVEQVMGRCSVEGSKMWFNCNPESPEHWFNKEWILKAKERNFLHLHFTMDDNFALADSIRKRYESMFTGVFYKRYILGQWCIADGLVYDFKDEYITKEKPVEGDFYISIDYGTLNPFSAGLWCFDGEKATRIDEYYYSGREKQKLKTDEEYYSEIENLAGNLPIKKIIVDPSAASFIEVIRRHHKFTVLKANNEVLNGIMRTSRFLREGKILVNEKCKDCIREFKLYCWDEKSSEDKVVKENDHSMDEVRYFVNTVLKNKIRDKNENSIYL